MKNSKIFAALAIAAVSALSAVTFSVNAEETSETEAVTEAVTEAAEETTAAETEDETAPVKTVIQAEMFVNEEWNGSGDYTATIALSEFELDFGEFVSLLDGKDNVIDSSYYTVAQNGNESITFTVSEKYLQSLTEGNKYFYVDFENVYMSPGFAVKITPAETAVNTDTVSDSAVVPETGSPKTGSEGVGMAFGLLTVSGAAAFITRKKKYR